MWKALIDVIIKLISFALRKDGQITYNLTVSHSRGHGPKEFVHTVTNHSPFVITPEIYILDSRNWLERWIDAGTELHYQTFVNDYPPINSGQTFQWREPYHITSRFNELPMHVGFKDSGGHYTWIPRKQLRGVYRQFVKDHPEIVNFVKRRKGEGSKARLRLLKDRLFRKSK